MLIYQASTLFTYWKAAFASTAQWKMGNYKYRSYCWTPRVCRLWCSNDSCKFHIQEDSCHLYIYDSYYRRCYEASLTQCLELYSLPTHIVLDRGLQFVAYFTKEPPAGDQNCFFYSLALPIRQTNIVCQPRVKLICLAVCKQETK